MSRSTTSEPSAERVTALGARVHGPPMEDDQGPFQVMLDPEGNEFCLVA